MPELPEIETIKMQLAKVLPGERLVKATTLSPKMVQGNLDMLMDKKVEAIRRRAKVLIIDFSEGVSLAFHFKMSGQLVFDQDNKGETWEDRIVGGHPTEDFVGKLPSSHTRVIFEFEGGTMYFNDQRMFGWVKVGKKEDIEKEKFLESLGPEPFDIDAQKFIELVAKKKKPIKIVLMDQTVISGVGNIYANDACWEAGVDPKRLANTLTRKNYVDVYMGIVKVLREGIKYGGATAADAKYINLKGLGGHYQEHFRVYDREGMECLRKDGGIINKFVLGGRGTYFCPACQLRS